MQYNLFFFILSFRQKRRKYANHIKYLLRHIKYLCPPYTYIHITRILTHTHTKDRHENNVSLPAGTKNNLVRPETSLGADQGHVNE